jgi:hypothetical protein
MMLADDLNASPGKSSPRRWGSVELLRFGTTNLGNREPNPLVHSPIVDDSTIAREPSIITGTPPAVAGKAALLAAAKVTRN